MSDAASLRKVLQRTDPTAPTIQSAAGAMMKHYDKSPVVAVNEWRQAIHQARPDQYLPLLYVANEVLQNSKRNRGNKFLEAFSPVLGQSLILVSQNSPASSVEKVRRTVKIWGDRHVFSIRYVNELLKGLEPYRNGNEGGNKAAAASKPSVPAPPTSSPGGGAEFSPAGSGGRASPNQSKPPMQSQEDFDREMAMDSDDDEYKSDKRGRGDDESDEGNDVDDDGDDDDDDDDDLFGKAGSNLLKIDVDLEQAAASASDINKKKRRRGNDSVGISSPSHRHSKRRSIQSTNSLMELWNQVSSLQTSYDLVQGSLKELNNPDYLDEDSINQQIDSLVGDELLQEYKKVIQYEKRIANARRELYNIAQKRRGLELEAIRYLPWLETSLNQDQEDIEFCEKYRKQLELFVHVHKPARVARDERIQDEARRRKKEEELRRKREEEEERRRFMETAMSKQTEAKPGMVWNKATGEYQYLNQDEDWRN